MRDEAALANVSRASWTLRSLWRSRLVRRPLLDAEALEAAAMRGAPAAALGEGIEWRTPFRILVQSLREEARLNPLGLAMAQVQIVMALRARMRATSLWRAHPEILERPIPAPIVVLGQMRSGTTRMQRLLACDERLAHTRLYESLFPLPIRARKLRARAGGALMRLLNPEHARIHPSGAVEPEEEFGLFSFSFSGAYFEVQWRVPRFARWWEEADRRPLYREFRALVQTIGWLRGEAPGKPWILKVPQFMQDLPTLLAAFPDARLICLERDPEAVIASSASLVWNQMRIQSDEADKVWIGREWLHKTRLREKIAGDTRWARTDVPQIEVGYEAMSRDWRGEMERIYRFLGLELTSELLRGMESYLARSRRHLGHCYSLGDFGLSSGDLRR